MYDHVWCDDPEELPFAYTPALKARKIRLYVVCKMQGMPGKLYLTLRLLMSYIYMEHLFLMFLDHTQRRTTVGRTPLDE